LPAFDEPKGIAGWKPALRQRPKGFFISLLKGGATPPENEGLGKAVEKG
jgi:hypothetical protein